MVALNWQTEGPSECLQRGAGKSGGAQAGLPEPSPYSPRTLLRCAGVGPRRQRNYAVPILAYGIGARTRRCPVRLPRTVGTPVTQFPTVRLVGLCPNPTVTGRASRNVVLFL